MEDLAADLAFGIMALRDRAERQRVEPLLAQREHEYRTLAENSPDVIVRYDREGRRIYVNQQFERVNHISAKEWLARRLSAIHRADTDGGRIYGELMAAMASGSVAKIDLSWTKDGRPICWFVRVVPESTPTQK